MHRVRASLLQGASSVSVYLAKNSDNPGYCRCVPGSWSCALSCKAF